MKNDKMMALRIIKNGFLDCTGNRRILTLFFLINFNSWPPEVAM